MIRPATEADLPGISRIYDAIHDLEAAGRITTGWLRGIYPTLATAHAALEEGDLYVMEADGRVAASARINTCQVPEYDQASWQIPAKKDTALVLHTLTVDPALSRQGLARRFIAFYEEEARRRGLRALRMDTNARNLVARRLYASLGYREAGIVPCVFNGIPGVQLVCLEKAAF